MLIENHFYSIICLNFTARTTVNISCYQEKGNFRDNSTTSCSNVQTLRDCGSNFKSLSLQGGLTSFELNTVRTVQY